MSRAHRRAEAFEKDRLSAKLRALEAKGWTLVPVYLSQDSFHVLCYRLEDPANPGTRLYLEQAEAVQKERDALVTEVMES